MIFKVMYQESKEQVPTREMTQSLYLEARDRVEAIDKVTKNTPYNIQYVQELDEAHLAYEKEQEDFKLVEF
ncbi:DNA-directed RNA polymerase subunit epsilon [Facklamia miroungae]|uniref:DNA-directed RNA polymerase subunit epsilon n=1 Tax=Facklamia miroungae TaxID=120956 RepID=A0A1G7U3E7_9LACT|nr:DNA-directed RNA polymerase subunit epsilon [Facklamia miroungae]NKZ29883.1 DNA-dependent RNA polymerase auxiliary subunit epsilon family protein [Facklamia miroungae]SDG41781.1 DNA-dependent RNA polymerase auxiliary subunit epsilon [Facklamia miroungae]